MPATQSEFGYTVHVSELPTSKRAALALPREATRIGSRMFNPRALVYE